jgi:hypothetical protein
VPRRACFMTAMGLSPAARRVHTVRMKSRDRLRPASQAGGTLLDACAALALSSLAAATAVSGARPLACAVKVGSARTALAGALLEARLEAYAQEQNVLVEARAGDSAVTIQPGTRVRQLGDGVVLRSVPSDGNVQFRATGVADNGTLTVACGESMASVVVNQRGVIR